MKMIFFIWIICTVSHQDSSALPKGTPAEQAAAIRARLDADRAEYIRKFEKATTTVERDLLIKEVPRPELYANLMLQVADQNPNDPAALDALLWIMGNTPAGTENSLNAKAKAKILNDFSESNRLAPFAVALSWSPSASDEDALRGLLKRNQVAQVRAAATFGLARQLLAQAEMIDFIQIRLGLATTGEARRLVQDSLAKDFGKETAERFLQRSSRVLAEESKQLLEKVISTRQFADAEWPMGRRTYVLGDLARNDLKGLELRPGNPAPILEEIDLAGKKVSLGAQKGKVVLLTFWGHWCVACRGMYPLERDLSTTYASSPFTLIAVNSDQNRDLARKTQEAEKMTWPVIWDGGTTEGPLATRWNVKAWPVVVLIDQDGIIRYRFRGAPDRAILTPLVDQMVSEIIKSRK